MIYILKIILLALKLVYLIGERSFKWIFLLLWFLWDLKLDKEKLQDFQKVVLFIPVLPFVVFFGQANSIGEFFSGNFKVVSIYFYDK